MDRNISRRQLVGAVSAASITVAGCLNVFDSEGDGETTPGTESKLNDGNESSTDGEDESAAGDYTWPAIEAGEVVSDFETTAAWTAVTGDLETVSDAPSGTQAIAVESNEETAAMRIEFPRGLDLEGWDLSMAIKADAADRVHVEFMAPERGDHLTSIRDVPDDHDGWLRLDFGYIQKHGEPDLSNVRQLNIIAVGSDSGTRLVADDLRRTDAVDNGKAILALYDGDPSHYELAAPRLEERGWGAAVPVEPSHIGDGGRMDAQQLRELNDRGWDICSYPTVDGPLPALPEDRTQQIVETARGSLEDLGFDDGARHLFVPGDRLDEQTQAIIREHQESAFLFGASPTGAPPTGRYATPVIWGPDLHGGVRRAINLCDQYQQLVVLRIPRIVEEEAGSNSMSLADFEHLLDHLEHRGLDVVTPSDVLDGRLDSTDTRDDDQTEHLEGTILEAGEQQTFEGNGSTESETFDLADGVVRLAVTHDSGSPLECELISVDDDSAREIQILGTASGASESLVPVDAGQYRLAVDADDSWEIDLEQPAVHADDLEGLPASASGSGSAVVGPLRTEGNVSVTATYDGTGQFIVDGHGADGHTEQLINRVGEFDSSRSYSAGGAVWLTVAADGEWTLEIEA